jgi:hypothetical protein
MRPVESADRSVSLEHCSGKTFDTMEALWTSQA